jgi:hypothetical protein
MHPLSRTRGLSRREFLRLTTAAGASGLAFAWPASADDRAEAPPLIQLAHHPLLATSLYRLPVSKDYSTDGAAGSNRQGYRWVEEQRQGAEWVLRGAVQGNADWVGIGWLELDWGLAHQQPDGGFASEDAFHSTSFYVEALARSCIIDPQRATATRVQGLLRAARWLTSPDVEGRGALTNKPYTHRRYILAAALGQAGRVTADERLQRRAAQWAQDGLRQQQSDGTNPEKGGYDAGYQMVGVLMALRYLPVCDDAELRAGIRSMIRKAVVPELARQRPDGAIDATGSTRIGSEHGRSGKTKTVPYGEIAQALVFGAEAVPEPSWIAPAERIAVLQKWLKA